MPVYANIFHDIPVHVRCMGFLIRFIHNRDLAAENIMTANCRLRAVLNSPPDVVKSLLHRMQSRGVSVPNNSIMKILADTKTASRPGNTEVVLVRSRRNLKQVQLSADFMEKAKPVYTLGGHVRRFVQPFHNQMISGMYSAIFRYICILTDIYRYILRSVSFWARIQARDGYRVCPGRRPPGQLLGTRRALRGYGFPPVRYY